MSNCGDKCTCNTKGYYNIDNYYNDCKRTDLKDYQIALDRIDNHKLRLLHSAIGISTEVGELLDNLKKVIFYGKSIDYINLKEEIGDLLYYIAISLDELGVTFEEVMDKNIAKLKARYPDKFTKEKALNRDLEKEREVLEEFKD